MRLSGHQTKGFDFQESFPGSLTSISNVAYGGDERSEKQGCPEPLDSERTNSTRA